MSALVANNGANKCAEVDKTPGEGGVIAREDLAELIMQVALRLPRSLDENAPRRRVVKVSPVAADGGTVLQERPNEDILTGRCAPSSHVATSANLPIDPRPRPPPSPSLTDHTTPACPRCRRAPRSRALRRAHRTVGTVKSLDWREALREFGPTTREY